MNKWFIFSVAEMLLVIVMAVLVCSDNCGSKVESNRCCGNPMDLKGTNLNCKSCKKEVSANNCCGKAMKNM